MLEEKVKTNLSKTEFPICFIIARQRHARLTVPESLSIFDPPHQDG